jgi:uncharacterized protein YegP (UPF0339 family)
MTDVVEFYKDASDQWRWRRKARNGKVIADGSEGYVNLDDAKEQAERINKGDVRFEVNREETP